MNPTNPFGSPQGAFQAPSTSVKTGLFQSFGQQSSNNQAQSMGFFQPPAFGQPSVLNQPAAHGNTIFGQAPTFGQPPAQPPSLPTISQAPAFGQPSLGMNSSGFASGTTPAFGQTTGLNQSSVFGQTPAFGQPSAFGQAPGFGKPPPAFGQQSSGFGNSQMATGSTTTPGQPQPLNFGQSMFGQPSTTSGSASVFGAAQSVTQSRAFGSSEFSFKPANEALFKPIFSVSPEPANPQTTTVLSSAFGVSGPQTGSNTMSSNTMSSSTTTTTNFSLLTAAKSGPHGFSFSQPAAPSVSAQNNPPTTGTSSSATGALQFTFSQPAAPSSSSTTEPTTPSSFSFTTKTLQTQPAVLLGGAVFGQPSAFGDIKAKAEISTDEKGSSLAVQGDTNIFARFSKGTKRKDDPAAGCSGPEKSATEEDVAAGADSLRHPSKRPLIRSRGLPGGLFSRALSGIRRDRTNPVKRDVSKEPQTVKWEENNMEEPQAQYDDLSATPSNMSRDVLEKPEVSDSSMTPDPAAEGLTPKSRGAHRDSLDSLSGISPSDLTSIQCRDVPAVLNKKDLLEKHFARFGKVCRIICRPAKNVAIIHFDDHAAAAKAKKRGKVLHRHELLLLWQKKKQSPGEKGSRPAPGKEESEEKSQQVPESKAASSPLRRPTLRPAALSSSHTFSSSVMKSSPVKVLQFDTEPQKETSTEIQSLERPVPSSLLHLIGQVAETTEEKYRLLEQKDKILRQDRPKRTDLLLSSVFVGTCPDMCPEKERYMRETRNQLSVFEVIPETEMVDHSAAIKEYSRSSADQEEPLPHELRPLPVLSMTMDYLVTQIMDQVQDNYRDWYDFVWNRTRGIRKDITQQRLCCPHTVSLIEKCTRFHVHCAHHLCEEPMMSFDAKINNENMTKCLQSLKEMYEDLATQQTFCPHEAEFRQYSVLLKLNDGDILREVQQFRHEVRKSPEVKFAVQAFAAVSSNNFVRFFKLVKGASYLASCLLHRYFNQVRAKALKALNMAHTVGPRSTPFPVEDVVRMLMFRNAEEATDFIQQYGLNVNDGVVDLSRTAFQEPELPLSQRKSEVILTKKMALVGQVVNGGPLPNPPQHRPVCSFDSQNKYRREGPLAEPTSSFVKAVAANVEVAAPPSTELSTPFILVNAPDVPSEFLLPPAVAAETGEPSESYHPPSQAPDPQQLFQPIPQPQPVRPPSPPPKPQLVYTDEDIMSALDCLIEEVVEVAVREVANDGASYAAAALTESSAQLESLASEVLGQMLQEISSNEIKLEQERVAEEKRKLEEARRRQEHEAFLAQFSCSLCTEVIHEVLDETIQETASSEIQKALNEKAERVAKCTEQVCSSLIDETLNIDIAQLVEDILEAELQRIHKYIKRWRDVVAVRRQLKRQMRGFPAAPCCVDPRFKLKALAPSAPAQPSTADLARGLVNLGNAGTLALSSTRLLKMRRDAIHQMRVHFCYQQLLEEMAWAPLDLPALVTENIPNAGDQIFWKALLLLPSDHESVASLADRILSGWLEVKLGGDPEPEEQPDGVLQTLCISTVLQESGQRTHKVHVTVKAARGPLTEDSLSKVEESCELQGTGALIMLLPALPGVTPGQEEQDVPLLSALLQLKQLQKANTWHCPLPLVVLVPGPDRGAAESQNLEEALMLHTLMKEGLISEYIFFFIPETTSDLQGPKQLNQALCWLLARAPPPFPLSCQTLVQLVEATLSREFSSRVYANRQDRTAAGLPSQGPAPVIQLYNSVLAHVADQVASQDLCRLSWPPGEFCVPDTCGFVPHLAWNSAQHLSWLRTAILSLQLPEWQQPCPTDSWTELCSSILCYAATIPSSRHSQPLLMSRLENLLERIRLKARHAKSRVSKASGGSSGSGLQNDHEAFTLVPWDDVVVICIDHKLKDWQIPEPPVCKDAVTEDGEILVYFPTESSSGFQPPAEWTQAVRQTHREKQQQMDRASAAACAPSAGSSLRQRLFHSLMEPVEAPPAPLDITHTATAQELLAHRVLQSLQEEKAESKRSMEQLQRWVDGDPLDHLSTPLFVPSSTLLSTPTTIKWVAREKSREAAFTQKPEPDEPLEKEALRKTTPVSLAWRLKDLERQILASQEEELACKLKLSGLLSIVED